MTRIEAARSPLVARGLLSFGLCTIVSCGGDGIVGEGLLGRAIPLVTGDLSTLPRLAFIDEGCPGEAARGGCEGSGDRACKTLLIDTLAPLTALAGDTTEPTFETECFEIRAGVGTAGEAPAAEDLAGAVSRFRFRNVPLVRAPAEGTDEWTWFAGSSQFVAPSGVLGGNLLGQFAIALRRPVDDTPTVAFYVEFPGSEIDLANQGRAFLPLQFPGRLLGRDLGDRCVIGDDGCRIEGFDLVRAQPNYALEPSRMVLDACVAAPPCGVRYAIDPLNPFDPGDCDQTIGPNADAVCTNSADPDSGGVRASLVVATSVDDVVLFEDSAIRMFGPLEMLPPCPTVTIDDRACLVATDGVLALPGWPPAGTTTPLSRLKVRSIALVPGATRARDVGPCERVEERRRALLDQCRRYVDAVTEVGDVRNTTPPYSSIADDEDNGVSGDPANTSLVVLGEHVILDDDPDPDANRWLDVIVLPEAHPLPVSLRLDVAPEALAPDGLIGSALLEGTATVLDYTDPNPAVRVSCFDPRETTCMVAPDCRRDAEAACCHGLPLNLLVEFIVLADDETCCTALSAAELGEIQEQGFCLGTQPP